MQSSLTKLYIYAFSFIDKLKEAKLYKNINLFMLPGDK